MDENHDDEGTHGDWFGQAEEEGEQSSYAEWVAAAIGPRQVGGRYRSGYCGMQYTVVAIEPGPREDWPVWQITILWDGQDEPVAHCTAWEEWRDQVLAQPDAEDAVLLTDVAGGHR